MLIEARGLKKHFRTAGIVTRAVDGVDLSIREGETVGLVGESGCGKSTLGRTIILLKEPTAGQVFFKGKDIATLSGGGMRQLRRTMQIVFQDPFSSLPPGMKILDIIGRPLEIHGLCTNREDKKEKVSIILDQVGLSPDRMYAYPHEFSGGQRTRISIARALITSPEFVVLDEPTSALDVSVQARILNLLLDILERLNLSCLFISHDLSVVGCMCDRIAVMYLGEIVEEASAKGLFDNPLHPYTQMLLSALLIPDFRLKKEVPVEGEPTILDIPAGCKFYNRCHYRGDECKEIHPLLVKVESQHSVACHHSHSLRNQ